MTVSSRGGQRRAIGSLINPQPNAGLLIFRVFLGAVLVYGTQDNVFSGEQMHEFAGFLEQNGFPLPLASAYLSAWAQFVAGILIGVGFLTRIAALVMVINFIVALAMVHVGLEFSANIAPLAMLFGSLMLVLTGPGKYAIGRSDPVDRGALVSSG